jgi:hypothetical protein
MTWNFNGAKIIRTPPEFDVADGSGRTGYRDRLQLFADLRAVN